MAIDPGTLLAGGSALISALSGGSGGLAPAQSNLLNLLTNILRQQAATTLPFQRNVQRQLQQRSGRQIPARLPGKMPAFNPLARQQNFRGESVSPGSAMMQNQKFFQRPGG